HVANRRLRLGFDLRLALGRSAPRRDDESGTALHDLLEFVVAGDALRVLLPECARPFEQTPLYIVQQRPQAGSKAAHRNALLRAGIAPGNQHRRLFDVLRTDLDAERHTAQLPLRELPARPLIALVERDADAGIQELAVDLLCARQNRLAPVLPSDGYDDHLV